MSRRKVTFPAMGAQNLAYVAALLLVLLQLSPFSSAQKVATSSKWPTLDGSAPLVIARGGFSGLFPDSSSYAYNLAMMTSVTDVVLWCDVQLTKDGVGICFPYLNMNNGSDITLAYPKRQNTYVVNGAKTAGYFPIDFTAKELASVHLNQGIFTRIPDFDGNMFQIQTVGDVFTQNKPVGFWLNVQYDTFYTQHKLSMRSFIISASKSVIISHISSPEVGLLKELAKPFASTKTKLVFRFLDLGSTEPTTNQTYGSLLKNLTFIKTFASGILVPKTYIWPVDPTSYLLPQSTSLVADAHKNGLAVFASDFADDNVLAYNYSYNPVSEYLNFIDTGGFAVDGVLSDFPVTPSEARECFAHIGSNASAQAKPLVISHFGASGDLPGCTDLAYQKAISDGADYIDCPVQLSKDGVPFCLSSVNLMNTTLVTQTSFRNLLSTVSEIQGSPGIFSFSLQWSDIQGLTPVISSPFTDFGGLVRNPKFRTVGKIISLADFLALAKNATSLSGVSIKIENAIYLAENQGLSITEKVLDALEAAGYNSPSAKKVMIQSTNSAVLKAIKGKNYELVYEVDEIIRSASNATIQDIKSFAASVVVDKKSVFADNGGFLLGQTDVVSKLQSFKLNVYAQRFANEFVSVPYDFFSDPIVEINSYVMGAGIDGVITDFPQSAAAYKRNRCLNLKNPPSYMSPVQPAQLIQLVTPEFLPPAEAPSPLLNVSDVSEPPLPAVAHIPSSSPSPTLPAETPKKSPNGQAQITASSLLSCLAVIAVVALLL